VIGRDSVTHSDIVEEEEEEEEEEESATRTMLAKVQRW
jgi:hypothetical protein